MIACEIDNEVTLYDIENERKILNLNDDRFGYCFTVFSSDSSVIIPIYLNSCVIKFFSTDTGDLLKMIEFTNETITNVCFSSDSRIIFIAILNEYNKSVIYCYDCETTLYISQINVGDIIISDLCISSDNNSLFLLSQKECFVFDLTDTRYFSQMILIPENNFFENVVFNTYFNDFIVSVFNNSDNKIVLFNGEFEMISEIEYDFKYIKINPVFDNCVILNNNEFEISIFKLTTFELLHHFIFEDNIKEIVFNKEGTKLAIVFDEYVKILNIFTLEIKNINGIMSQINFKPLFLRE